jgi:acid phosphatase family membrane protein YuiD
VSDIHEPGQTLTLKVAAARDRLGVWGYLDPDTGTCTRGMPSSHFSAAVRALNPHRG